MEKGGSNDMSGIGIGNGSSYAYDDFLDDDEIEIENNDLENKNDISEKQNFSFGHMSDSEELTQIKASAIKDVSSLMGIDSTGKDEDIVDQTISNDLERAVEVDIVDERFSEEKLNSLGTMDEVKFKSGDVARMCGKSDQQIRNYTKTFSEFLNVETINSHRYYKYEDVQTLKLIFNLRDKKKLTIQQTVDFLKGGLNSDNSDNTNDSEQNDSSVSYALMLRSIEDVFSTYTNKLVGLMEEKMAANVALLQDSIAQKEQIIEKNTTLLEKNEEIFAELQNIINNQSVDIGELKALNMKYEQLLEESMKQNEDISQKLDAMQQKKHRWFFK